MFSCALGIEISEETTPSLYMLLWRTMTDIGLSPYAAKNAYGRERPFMVRKEPVCTPGDEEALRGDPSYPSGHTAIGWGWSLILTELAPDRAEALLARGRAFGESRNVCNAHWYSDVVAGRMTGAAAVGMHPVLIIDPEEDTPGMHRVDFEGDNWNGPVILSLNEVLNIVQ